VGLPLRDLTTPKELAWEALAGRTLAVDGYNALYQFLATIRQRDGQLFTDTAGRPTSHLIGLLYRTTSLLAQGVRPVFVFDGKPPDLKAGTLSSRLKAKEKAREAWDAAIATGDLVVARRKAAQTSRLTHPMVEEAARVLEAIGLPTVVAPSEGEAEAAFLAASGRTWGTASEDYDALLFGTPRLVRGLAARGGRGQAPAAQLIDREELLRTLGITPEELLLIGLVVGTDYNEGVAGYGPKKALKLVQRHLGWDATLREVGLVPAEVEPVAELFRHPAVAPVDMFQFREPNDRDVERILVEEHGFSSERVRAALGRARAGMRAASAPAAAVPGKQTLLEAYEGGGAT